jgi:hypothetical protein
LFLNCVYLLTSTGKARSIDEIDPVLQSESILLRHMAAIPQAVNSGIYFGKIDRHGVPRSAWPAGHALMVLPWSAVGHWVLAPSPGIPRAISDLAISTAVCWSNATFAALAVAAFFLICLKIADIRSAMIGSLVLAFATPLFVYSGWLFSEPASTALFVLAALTLFGTGAPVSTSRALLGALLLGFSIHVRPANLVTVLVFVLASIVADYSRREAGRGYRTAAILVAVVAISGGIYLARNYAWFGNPWDFGVPATAENGKDIESWHNPFWRGIAGFLFSPGKSLILFCPPAILGVIGLPRLGRSNRALAVLAGAAPVANLVLYSFRTQWEGSYCYGPRYLLPSLVLLCLPVAVLLHDPPQQAKIGLPPQQTKIGLAGDPGLAGDHDAPRWLRPLVGGTFIAGFLIQVIGLSVNVLEDMVRHHYYNAHWDYQLAYSPIPGQLRLIWKYLHVRPAGIGLGWDRWFVMLRTGGASPSLVTAVTSLFFAGALAFGLLTWKAFSGQQSAISRKAAGLS